MRPHGFLGEGSLSDAGSVVLALATALGAAVAVPVPAVPAVVGVAVALVRRVPWLLVATTALLASSLAAQSWAGLAPAAARPFDGEVALATDPDEIGGLVRADVRAGAERYELWARGATGRVLRSRLAGERFVAHGQLAPRPAGADWLARRHVVGRLTVDHVGPAEPADPASALANALRRTLVRGAEPLPPLERALFAGFVLGDDRDQRDEVVDDFRASGLAHLLAVSGQNVAFVLALVQPAVARLGLRARLGVIVVALAFFAIVTRCEPSVMRATAMAVLSTLAVTAGRKLSAVRALALAVTVLLLVDPLLVGVVGFQLSVAACAGIVVLASRIAAALPGPRWAAGPLGITVAAQVGVAPVLVPLFGGIPVATLPANLAAGPVAGPVMAWGLSGGVVAGLAGGAVAGAVHLPTRAALWWVATVARWGATAPLGTVRAPQAAMLVVAGAAWWGADRWSRGCLVRGPAVAIALVALVSAAWMPATPTGARPLADGATLHHAEGGGTVLVLDGRARLGDVLRRLREDGVGHLDAVVARSAGPSAAHTVAVLAERFAPVLVVAPTPMHPAAVVPRSTAAYEIGGVTIRVTQVGGRLEVQIDVQGSGEQAGELVHAARGPPGTGPGERSGGWV